MKKTLITISTLLFSITCLAAEIPTSAPASASNSTSTAINPKTPDPIEEGKQYIKLPTNPSPDKEVIEFFSFNCPSCFRFETEFHGPQAIAKSLPEGVKFKRYHLDNFGPLSMELSQAWAIANVLNIQDKASEALYMAIHKDRKIKTADDIKAVFATLGVDSETYDKTKDNFLVAAFMSQQADALKELQPTSIPAIIVNRTYYINATGLDATNNDTVINDYARVAAYLVNLNPNSTAPITK